jgi:hypothetical protein
MDKVTLQSLQAIADRVESLERKVENRTERLEWVERIINMILKRK